MKGDKTNTECEINQSRRSACLSKSGAERSSPHTHVALCQHTRGKRKRGKETERETHQFFFFGGGGGPQSPVGRGQSLKAPLQRASVQC